MKMKRIETAGERENLINVINQINSQSRSIRDFYIAIFNLERLLHLFI